MKFAITISLFSISYHFVITQFFDSFVSLLHAKFMQNQMVKSGVVISGGYQFIGIVIGEIYEVNVIKNGESISHLL